MSFTVGRASFADDPSAITYDGPRVAVEFEMSGATLIEMKVLRQQVLGLASNADEPIVPVTWSADTDLDGFYRVLSATTTPIDVHLVTFTMNGSILLQRVGGGYARANVETAVSLSVRTNGVGVVDTEPDGITDWRIRDAPAYGGVVGVAAGITRLTEDGNIRVALDTADFAPVVASTVLAPTDFYRAAATIEVSLGGTWYPVANDQAPAGMAGNWRITNGLVRFTPSSTNVGDLKIEVYDTSAWVTMETELRYGQDSSGTFSQPTSEGGFFTGYDQENAEVEWVEPHIIRNDRDTVILGFQRAAGYFQTLRLDAAHYFAEFRSTIGSGFVHAIQSRSAWVSGGLGATAPFSYDPGISSNSNDGNGNRLCLLYTDDGSWTKYSGSPQGIYVGTGGVTRSFGIGAILAGSSAAVGDAGLDLAEQYCAVTSWRSEVVAR